ILPLFPGCSCVTSLLGIPFGVLNWAPSLLGFSFSLGTRYMAKADLAKMRAGLMHPAGEELTFSAESFSTGGLVCSILAMVVWGGLLLLAWWTQGRLPL